MPNPKQNTVPLNFRIDRQLIEDLQKINPSLVTIEAGTGRVKFGHGMLRRYFSRLIQEDINSRRKHKEQNVLEKFNLGENNNE